MDATVISGQKSMVSTKGTNIALWAAQAVLAAMFLMSGGMKLLTPPAELAAKMGSIPIALIRFIGASEVAGAVGLILPSLLKIRPRLTVWAARGLTVVMFLAMVLHLVKGEGKAVVVTLLLGALAAFVSWGRSSRVPIRERA